MDPKVSGALLQMSVVGRVTPCAPRHVMFRRAEDYPPYRAPAISTPNAFARRAV
jgi:hypothetical protein